MADGGSSADGGLILPDARTATLSDAGSHRDAGTDPLPDAADPGDTGVPPDPSCARSDQYPARGWQARHFRLNPDNSFGDCLFVEDVANDTFDRQYGSGGPTAAATDRFGTRYIATRTLAANAYHFYLSHDDGVRIFVDGRVAYDRWETGARENVRLQLRYLEAGDHTFVVEHFDDTGDARLAVRLEPGCAPLDAPLNDWRVAFHPLAPDGTIDRSICYGIGTVRSEELELDWAEGGPMTLESLGIADNFAMVGRARRDFRGVTRIQLSYDDGLRAKISNTTVHEGWEGGPRDATVHAYATGSHVFEFEYFERTVSAKVSITWRTVCEIAAAAPADGWYARYYRVTEDTATMPSTFRLDRGDCLGVETIPGLHLSPAFPGEAPAQLVGLGVTDRFGAEYTATRTFLGDTTVQLFHDDGLRMFTGNTRIYDSWLAPQVVSSSFRIGAGTHSLRAEYFDNYGGADLSITW